MEGAVRLRSFNKKFVLGMVVLAVAGCARSAPELPPVSSHASTQRPSKFETLARYIKEADCAELDERFDKLDRKDAMLEGYVKSNRTSNQLSYYFSALFPPLMFATENDDGAKAGLDLNQAQRDQLIVAYREKGCTAPELSKK